MNHIRTITLFAALLTSVVPVCTFAAPNREVQADPSSMVARADVPWLASSLDVADPAEQPLVDQDVGRRRARVAAASGPDSLRRFVQRTRMIYGLQYQDFAADLR